MASPIEQVANEVVSSAAKPPAGRCVAMVEDFASAMNWTIVAIHGDDHALANSRIAPSAAAPIDRLAKRLSAHLIFVSAQGPAPASAGRISFNHRILIVHAQGWGAALDTACVLGLRDHPHLFLAEQSDDRLSVCRVDGDVLCPVIYDFDVARQTLARDFSQVLAARRLMRRSPEKTLDHGRYDASNWIKSLGLPMNSNVTVSDVEENVRRFMPGACRHDPIVYIHGGGLVHYDLSVFSPYLSHLADLLGAPIFAVGYPKCPETDAGDVIEIILQHVTSVADRYGIRRLMGDSIGGLLALYAASRSGGIRFRQAVLFYPVLSLQHTFPSYEFYGDGYLLDQRDMRWFGSLVRPWFLARGFDPVNGLQKFDDLDVTVVSAGCDVLADEAELFCRASGARHLRYPELPHDFCLYIQRMASATAAINDIAQILTEGEIHAELP